VCTMLSLAQWALSPGQAQDTQDWKFNPKESTPKSSQGGWSKRICNSWWMRSVTQRDTTDRSSATGRMRSQRSGRACTLGERAFHGPKYAGARLPDTPAESKRQRHRDLSSLGATVLSRGGVGAAVERDAQQGADAHIPSWELSVSLAGRKAAILPTAGAQLVV
jgi:hypothetical protein